MSSLLQSQAQQTVRTVSFFEARAALSGLIDYIVFGVKNRYCFTNNDLFMNDTPSNCNLQHDGSIERLVMSVDTQSFVQQLVSSGVDIGPYDAKNLSINSIERYFDFSSATEMHPIFPIIDQLMKQKTLAIGGAWIKIERNDSSYIPKSGREVYLDITLTLVSQKKTKSALASGTKSLTAKSSLIVQPRELGMFSLIVPDSLYLNIQEEKSLPAGALSIRNFSIADSKSIKGKLGLVFNSPIFINRDLHLPDDSNLATLNSETSYTPVTFVSKIFFGNGSIKVKDAPFKPRDLRLTKGSSSWDSLSTIGGIQGGIEFDGTLDAGLDFFSRSRDPETPDLEIMNKCISHSLKLADLNHLLKSSLQGERNPAFTGKQADYTIYVTNE